MSNGAVEHLKEVSTQQLTDLGSVASSQYAGIYSPLYEDGYTDTYIHEQFTSGAEHYAKFYTKHNMFRGWIKKGLMLGGLGETVPGDILDIGSGAGNSVIPLVEMFPESNVVASDLSVELLALLKGSIETNMPSCNLALLQLNAEDLAFRERSFDLVVGAAILHHLFNPERTIQGCFRILRPGGLAIFFEPMQSANYLVRTFYRVLLSDPRSKKLPRKLRSYLSNRIEFFDDRVTIDKSEPRFLAMDDKWMFPRGYFEDLAQRYGFSDCRFQPIGDPSRRLRAKIAVHMKGIGRSYEDLPSWFTDIVDEFDEQLPEPMRQEVMGDCIITLKR